MKPEETNQEFLNKLSDRLERKEAEQLIEFRIPDYCPLCRTSVENIISLGEVWEQGTEIYSHGYPKAKIFYCCECKKPSGWN